MLQMDVNFINKRAYSGYEISSDGVAKVIDPNLGYDTVNFTPDLAERAFKDFLAISAKVTSKKLSPELRSEIISFYNNYGLLMQPHNEEAVQEHQFQMVVKMFHRTFANDGRTLHIDLNSYGQIDKAFKTYATPPNLMIYFLWISHFPTEKSWIVCKWRLINGSARKRNNNEQCPPNCILPNTKKREWGQGCRQAWYARKEK